MNTYYCEANVAHNSIVILTIQDGIAITATEAILSVSSDEFNCDLFDRRQRESPPPNVIGGGLGVLKRVRPVGCQSFYRCNQDGAPVYITCVGQHVFNNVTKQCDRYECGVSMGCHIQVCVYGVGYVGDVRLEYYLRRGSAKQC